MMKYKQFLFGLLVGIASARRGPRSHSLGVERDDENNKRQKEDEDMNGVKDGAKCIVAATMVVAACLLSGCATTPIHAYSGPELSEGQLAKISCYRKEYSFWNRPTYGEDVIVIHTLDGKKIKGPLVTFRGHKSEIFVLPGQHEVVAGYGSEGGGALPAMLASGINGKYDTRLIFNAQAGKTYIVFSEIVKKPEGQKRGLLESAGMWVYWIEDAQSGTVMCGRHPEESETFPKLKQHDYTPKPSNTELQTAQPGGGTVR